MIKTEGSDFRVRGVRFWGNCRAQSKGLTLCTSLLACWFESEPSIYFKHDVALLAVQSWKLPTCLIAHACLHLSIFLCLVGFRGLKFDDWALRFGSKNRGRDKKDLTNIRSVIVVNKQT